MAISDLIYVDQSGFHYPDYPTVLTYLQGEYRTIYGADTYLEADSQDGQWVAILALAMFDSMQVAAAVYNSFSPLTAQKDALSRNVKINGIARLVASYSTADLTIVGQAGTIILNGQAKDTLDQKWNLPTSVTIPVGGSIVVTATAVEIGAVSAAAGTINKIATPTLGWQTVNNLAAATIGDPVETDAELRRRQSQSTMIPSLSVMEGIVGAVISLAGVTRCRGYENDTNSTVGSLPPHSITIVVEGGSTTTIAETIAAKKTPGTTANGSTSVTVYDKYGMPNNISFYRPTLAPIDVEVSLTAMTGYLSTTGDAIKQATVDYMATLLIGDDVYVSKLWTPANLDNSYLSGTYNVTQIRIRRSGGSWVTTSLTLAFNEVADCALANVSLVVT